jgi:hypothetical protein
MKADSTEVANGKATSIHTFASIRAATVAQVETNMRIWDF